MKSFDTLINLSAIPKSVNSFEGDISIEISRQLGLDLEVVRKGIRQGQLAINGGVIKRSEITLIVGKRVTYNKKQINTERKNKIHFDRFTESVFKELSIISSENIPREKRSALCSLIIEYFEHNRYVSVDQTESEYLDIILIELDNFYKDNFKAINDGRLPRKKELVEQLINLKSAKLIELFGVVENLKNGVYNNNLYKFLQDYSKLSNSPIFNNAIFPLVSNPVASRAPIEALIKPIQDALQMNELDLKYEHFQKTKEVYSNYERLLDNSNSVHSKIYLPIFNYLFDLLKHECDTTQPKAASLSVSPLPRKYNFKHENQNFFELLLLIENTGEGLARDIMIMPLNDKFLFQQFSVGTLKPSEKRNVSISAQIVSHKGFEPILNVGLAWHDNSSEARSSTHDIEFQIQEQVVPWDELDASKPYTIQEIDEKEKLYGRDEILHELKSNILSSKIESYKIWGQKRVGKSSIVKTLKTLLKDEPKIIIVWRKISGLKNINPERTLNSLGESLCSEIFEEIDQKMLSTTAYEKIRDIKVPDFEGSLYPLEEYIRKIKRVDKDLKFVFILDEFDGINPEFFLPGPLGDTLSQNMGKGGLNESNTVGFILVGSENMHLLDKQIMNYNGFKELEVDTFSKERHFKSFESIIKDPVAPHINYSNESVEKIFEITNGNPYFANLICFNILKICIKNKDNEVHINTTLKAIDTIVSSSQKSHFDHFWSDGISEESNIKKERKADIRRRILISYSSSFYTNKEYPGRSEISKGFKKPEYPIEHYEIDNTINEFFNRKIFSDEPNGTVRIKPRLFESWLCGPGRTLMSEGISDLESLQRELAQEDEMALKTEELKRINERLTFHGHKLGVATYEKYFKQFGGPIEQRRVFNIIDSIFYISKDDVTTFFKKEQKNIFGSADRKLKLGARTFFREGVELYSFPGTIAENIEFIEIFKKVSNIRLQRTVKGIDGHRNGSGTADIEDIIVFESIIEDITRIQSELLNLLSNVSETPAVQVRLVVILVGIKAKAEIIKATSSYSNFSLIYHMEIDDSQIKPFIETTQVFETRDEASYAYLEVRKHFNNINKNSLNVLFEIQCPERSLPILWCKTNNFIPLYHNEHGKIYLANEGNTDSEFRTRLFNANTELSQKLNSFIVNSLKEKAAEAGLQWSNVKFVPAKALNEIMQRWVGEEQKFELESYLDFIHYKEIIKHNKDTFSTLQIGAKGLEWCDRLNLLRRIPAHPEKYGTTLDDVIYFEDTAKELIKRIERAERAKNNQQ